MFRIKNITIKNFMSVGAITQSLVFNEEELILVLGQNLDQGGNDSRNGVGKSTIINAVSYALYGEAIVKIKMDNLINKINKKNMVVTLDFEVNGTEYRIERGRKPNVFKFYQINDVGDEDNNAQGENKDTQKDIIDTIGLSLTMFKQIVGLNTFNEPFLSMTAANQREIIEQLLGITKLSEKAELLKIKIKTTKDAIKEEEYRIKAVEQSNQTIQSHIDSIKLRSSAWDNNHAQKLDDLAGQYSTLSAIDVAADIDNHLFNAEVLEFNKQIDTLSRELLPLERQLSRLKSDEVSIAGEYKKATHSEECPTCGSDMNADRRAELIESCVSKLTSIVTEVEDTEKSIMELQGALDSLGPKKNPRPVKYRTLDEARDHQSKVQKVLDDMERLDSEVNPYTDQIGELSLDGIQVIDYTHMDSLVDDKDHQEYLLSLLTNKDSFIRKRIIEQNLSFLNTRMSEYLDKMGLPHSVKFMSDLSVDIDKHGQSFDFDNLSRGEKTRLILSLSWAFRDIYENLNGNINLMFVDELIDNGLDLSGVESSLATLKKMAYENKRNIYLISHREELVGRVTGILNVVKQNEFTSFEQNNTGNVV